MLCSRVASFNMNLNVSTGIVPRPLFWCASLLPVLSVKVSVTFQLACVDSTFSSVSVAEWPPFGK